MVMKLTKMMGGKRYVFHQSYTNKEAAKYAASTWKSNDKKVDVRIRKLKQPHYDAFTKTTFPYGLYFKTKR